MSLSQIPKLCGRCEHVLTIVCYPKTTLHLIPSILTSQFLNAFWYSIVISATWTESQGWHTPKLHPYGPLTMSPIASCLQWVTVQVSIQTDLSWSHSYATQCFEGMKIYRGYDGKLRLFRPDLNAARLNMSSKRVSLPAFSEIEFVKLLKALMKVDGPSKIRHHHPSIHAEV